MATVTVKNIPHDLYEQLKVVAAANRRSVNSEIIVCIERRLGQAGPEINDLLRDARRLRMLTDAHPITEQEFNQAKMAGRP